MRRMELDAKIWYGASLCHLESSPKGASKRYFIFLKCHEPAAWISDRTGSKTSEYQPKSLNLAEPIKFLCFDCVFHLPVHEGDGIREKTKQKNDQGLIQE